MTDGENLFQRLADLSPSKRALLELLLKQHPGRAPAEQTIARRANREAAPLSFAQQRLWFIHQLEPHSSAYNEAMAVHLLGSLDVEALQRALDVLIERHESLRTSFVVTDDGTPMQTVGESRPFDLRHFDLSACPEREREIETQRIAVELQGQLFDLSRDLMARAGLIRQGLKEHVLVVIMHHIASDGWSARILRRELATLYDAFSRGEPNPLPELPIQYADYAVWQRQGLQGEVLEKQLSYWKKQLDGMSELALPTDRPRPAVRTYRGAKRSLHLPPSLSHRLKALSRQQSATLFMTLLAAFQALLHRYTGQDDFVIGTPIAGRNRVELENVIGFFINTLVVRVDFAGEATFQDLLAGVRTTMLDAYDHQDLPFEKLVEELQPERTVAASPIFQVTFAFQNLQEDAFPLRGLTVTPFEVDSVPAKFDLSLRLREQTDGLLAVLEYNTDLFDAATINRTLRHYQALLENIARNPQQRILAIPILTDSEKNQLLAEWNDTQRHYPQDKCVHELFEAQVERTPEAVAVALPARQITYRELNSRANQLARYLKTLEVGSETLVGICVEPSLEMLVGVLGILKAGGAYLPLDPSYPRERLEFMLEDSRAAVLLTRQRLVKGLPNHGGKILCLDRDWEEFSRESQANLAEPVTADNLVYVIYTSGSTGEPKGVMIRHKNLVHYLTWLKDWEPFRRSQNLPLLTKFSFDASIKQIFGPLIRGERVWILPNDIISQPAPCIEALSAQSGVALNCTPNLWSSLLDAIESSQTPALRAALTVLLLGGEQPWNGLIDRTASALPQLEIWNLYGPTEATANAIVGKITAGERITLGRPIANTEIYILDSRMHPVPIGVAGELYIGGAGIARGYLNRPALTAEKFVPNPFRSDPGAHLYRSGDLARYLPDGNIEFLGRIDGQVKIRGHRVELGEIESVLRQHPAVTETHVTVREDDPGDKRLIAYVVSKNDSALDSAWLRGYLRAKLPPYMMPSTFVFLERLPLTPHGKLDARALPAPEQNRPELAEPYQAPRNPVEESLAAIWAGVLKLEKVGVHDSFFDLGGHSLKAVQVVSRACKMFEVALPLRRLFETPTIAGLAEGIETLRWATQNAAPPDAALTSEEETGEV